MKKEKTVLVFGVFDLLHPGHGYFLKTAAKKGSLIVVVARDKAVFTLKGRKPDHSEKKRLTAVRAVSCVARAVLGDSVQGKYSAIKKYKPDIVCLGYDQIGLGKDIRARIRQGELKNMCIMTLPSHFPEKYRTSLVRNELKNK
jgi:FAD synthetase